jgi:RHS repeat-associated protein
LIYTATTAPYSVDVTATTVGSHTVTAVATDNNGASTTSNAALVTITSAPVNSTPQAYYIHTDQLNTPRLITDNNNQAVWRWDNWEPFGNYITDEDPSNTGNKFTFNLRFPGQYYDSETQTHYNYFRDYDPETGRYIQSDPIGLGGGINTYGYVSGSPMDGYDPYGLLCFDFNAFADQIEENRASNMLTLGSLISAGAVGTMPKTPSELRGMGVPKSQLNPITGQLSRWSSRLGIRALRDFGRTAKGVTMGAVATGAVIFEGFYDWGVIARAAYDATTSESECGDCKK